MRIFPFLCVVLMVSVVVSLSDSSEAYSSDPPEGLDDFVIIESYKKISSSHIVIGQSTKSAYPIVVVYAFTSQQVKVIVNEEVVADWLPSGDGGKLLLHFSEGDNVNLRVSVGAANYDYSFTVRKTISIKELDPDEDSSELPFFDAWEVFVFCLIVFVSGAAGVYAMYRLFKHRAMMEVRPLGGKE